MWKTAAIGASALVIAGSMVYAQQRRGFDVRRGYDAPRASQARDWRPSAQDLSAFADARIAALHAGLQLNADQEKNWPAFEQALRELAKMRLDRLAARDQQQAQPQTPASPIERLQRRADAMSTRGAALKRLADAAAPLYQSLDDAQKHRFTVLARFMRLHERHRMAERERFGGGQGGFGGFGMHRDGFPGRRFGEDQGMRGPSGMGPMNRRDMNGLGGRTDEEDYRGPL
jgi:zinc resistance-associated protein